MPILQLTMYHYTTRKISGLHFPIQTPNAFQFPQTTNKLIPIFQNNNNYNNNKKKKNLPFQISCTDMYEKKNWK